MTSRTQPPSDGDAEATFFSHARGRRRRDGQLKFFNIEQIADFLVVSTRTVRRWIRDKLLVAHRINGVVRISERDFATFLDENRDD